MLTINKSKSQDIGSNKFLSYGFTVIATSVLTLASTSSASAISLIGNPTTNPTPLTNLDIAANTNPKSIAIKFMTPSGLEYFLNSVVLRLNNYTPQSQQSTDTIAVKIRNDNGSDTNTPGTDVVTFTGPVTGSNTVATDYIFTTTPNTTRLFASTSYWLSVEVNAGNISWIGAAATPTSSVGYTFNQYSTSNDLGTVFTAGATNNNSFVIDGTAVPFEFEASGGVAILGGLFLANKFKNRKKVEKSDEQA
ncbi:MAG: hypothetical protein AUK48_04310 [Oscillatoriales cyanobacterium CG2_30_44_21]|nr:MAG: hypothetical protein AUK48_04310 [Oscillatoriales cyanobacterium CG2_30_44_21]